MAMIAGTASIARIRTITMISLNPIPIIPGGLNFCLHP